MEMRHLECVEAIARLGSFTRAAHELHVAQPAVSAQVAALERRLGTRLFIRTPAGAEPTHAGRLVADLARRVRASVEETSRDLRDLQSLLSGTVSVGATPLLGPVDLPGAAARFAADHPGVRLRIRTDLIGPLIRDLERGRLDVVVGPLDTAHLADERRTPTRVLHAESLSLITSPAYPIASVADAREVPFVCLPEGSGLRRLLDAACLRHGFAPRVDIEVADPRDIPQYVAAGLGAALVATSIARRQPPGSIAAEILDEPTHPPIGLIASSRPSAAASALLDRLASPGA